MFAFWGLIALPLVGAPLVYLIGQASDRRPAHSLLLGLGVTLGGGMVYVDLLRAGLAGHVTALHLGAVAATLGGVGLLLGGLALVLTLLVLVFAAGEWGGARRGSRDLAAYTALLLISLAAVIGLCCTRDLFNLWVWFETLAVSSYLLVAFERQQIDALAACIKYLLQTAAASILIVFGIALLLAGTGTLDLAAIQADMQLTPMMIASVALLTLGFGVKAALVPTYTWLPDAYTAAPSGVSALLAGVVTVTGLIALLRALALFAGVIDSLGALLLVYGVLGIVIGSLLALGQPEVKRMLAYSSLVHLGFMLVGLGIGIQTGDPAGYYSAMLHLVVHGMMKALAFLAVGALIVGLAADQHITLADLTGAGYRFPLVALALTVALFSLVGLPPLAGFVSKWQLLRAATLPGHGLNPGAALLMAGASVFSLAYYLPVVNALFSQSGVHTGTGTIPLPLQAVIVLLLLVIVVLGFMPGLLDPLVSAAGAELQHAFQ